MRSGSLLRNAMLVNSMLFNAEAWHSIIRDHIESLSRVDESPNMNSKDIELLFALRTKTVRGIRSDFCNMYTSDQRPLCETNPHKDTIQELMT